jgi:transposase-like protein
MKISSEEKALWLEDWRQSGKSARAYAKENGLNPQTFARWTKTATAAKPCFVEVPVPVAAPAMKAPTVQAPEILIEKGDMKIHIPLCLNRSDMRAAMEALGAAL